MIVKTRDLYVFLPSLLYFSFSMFILPYAVHGDQEYYNKVYEAISSLDLIAGYAFYNSNLSAFEPVYFLLAYALSPFISKVFLMSLVNGLFGGVLFNWLYKQNVHPIICILLGMNFYFLVLLISAERLKFAVLLLLLGVMASGRRKVLYLVLGVLSHFQILIFLMAYLPQKIMDFLYFLLICFRLKKRALLQLIFIIFSSLLLWFVAGEIINKKVMFYMEKADILGSLKCVVFLAATMWFVEGRTYKAVMPHLVIIMFAMFIGSDRLVMFSYFIFLYYALTVNRGLNFLGFTSSGYFVVKGVFYLFLVYSFGDGFKEL